MPELGIRFSFFVALFTQVVINLATTELYAQGFVNINSLNAVNLSNVRAAVVSDQNLKTILERTKRQGHSIDQALELAVTRGLSASEAQQLRARIMDLQDEVAVTTTENVGGLRPANGNLTMLAEVSLVHIRTISVTVTGEVNIPEIYSISSLSMVFYGLSCMIIFTTTSLLYLNDRLSR